MQDLDVSLYAALGRVLIRFAAVEHLLATYLGGYRVDGKGYDHWDKQTIGPLVIGMRSVFTERWSYSRLLDELKGISDTRNDLVHGETVEGFVVQEYPTFTKFNRKTKSVITVSEESLDSLSQRLHEIAAELLPVLEYDLANHPHVHAFEPRTSQPT